VGSRIEDDNPHLTNQDDFRPKILIESEEMRLIRYPIANWRTCTGIRIRRFFRRRWIGLARS
jgi:hypothetical protein